MKHVKSIFALALVGTLSVACAAPTEEEGSGSSEEAAALDEVVETGTVSSAANLLTACRPGDTATLNKTTNYQGVKLPKDGVFSVCRAKSGSYYSAVATRSPAKLALLFRRYTGWGFEFSEVRASASDVTRFEEPGSARLGMIDCSVSNNSNLNRDLLACSSRTSQN